MKASELREWLDKIIAGCGDLEIDLVIEFDSGQYEDSLGGTAIARKYTNGESDYTSARIKLLGSLFDKRIT